MCRGPSSVAGGCDTARGPRPGSRPANAPGPTGRRKDFLPAHGLDEINAGRTDDDNTGLDPVVELPFHDQMAEKMASSAPDAAERLVALTVSLVAEVRRITGAVGFWDNATKQDELRKAVKRLLDRSDLFAYDAGLDELAVELVAIAKANQHRLT